MSNKINLLPLVIFIAIFLFQERAFAQCRPETGDPVIVCSSDTVCRCPDIASDTGDFYYTTPDNTGQCYPLCRRVILGGYSGAGLCKIAGSIAERETLPPECPQHCRSVGEGVSSGSPYQNGKETCCSAWRVTYCESRS